jgi:predicted ATPase
MGASEPGLKAARDATVQICDSDGRHLGQGLVLALEGEGGVVLTCHHVIAETDPAALRVRRADDAGEPGEPVPARLDEEASKPERDAVVLRVDGHSAGPNPLLHAIDPDYYDGSLPAIGLTWMTTDNFGAELQAAARRLRVKVPHPPHEYTLPVAFRLKDPSDAQQGISGGVVLCEEGVVGLVHFARRDTPTQQRQAYLNPLSAWVEGLPALGEQIEPFVEAVLRKRADVLRAEAVLPDGGLLDIAGYRDDVYLPRSVNEAAAEALEQRGAVLVVGRHLSGKSRLACELLHRHPNAIVVVPRGFDPPGDLREDSSFVGREVVLLFENMHLNAGIKPVEWLSSMQGICERALVIATSRNDQDWQFVEQWQDTLLDRLGVPCVFISKDEGEDLSEEEGRKLADSLGLSPADFERRFDGTPGSLLVDEERPTGGGPALPPGAQAGTTVTPVSAQDAPPNNLPSFSSTFVGRREETRDIEELLARHAVVTLSGPDGRGKTRLAAHVATTLLPSFPDGAWWIELSSYSEPALVSAAATAALGIHESASATSTDRLVQELSGKRALIVLNGIDDIVEACAGLATAVVGAGPELRVICTGRSPLGIADEAVYPVRSLSLSGPETPGNGQSEAVNLFLQRARRHVSEEDLADVEHAQIADIVGRLNGNPLAIELAAAHLADARVEDLAEELEEEELTAPADDPERAAAQRVDATLDCALDGLDEQEARLFARLGAFAGGWSLSAAVATGGGEGVDPAEVPDLVRRLVDRSLLLMEESGPEDRFRILDSVRRRAQARLDALPERARVRRRHAGYYAGFVERAKARLTGPHADEWFAELDREEDNCRAALTWALREEQVDVGLRLGAALWWPWYQRSRFREGRRWLEELLRQAPPEDRVADEDRELGLALAEVLNGAGNFAYNQGDLDAAEEWNSRSLGLRRRVGEEALTAGSLNNLGLVARRRGDYERAANLFREAISVSRRWENAHWEAMHLNNLGNVVREQADEPEEARQLQEEALTIFTRLGSGWGIAMATCDLGMIMLDCGETDDGGAYLRHSLELRERMSEPGGVAQSLNGLARFERLKGELEAAEEHCRRALRIFDDIGDRLRAAESLEALAIVNGASRRPRRAARLFAAAGSVREAAGAPLPAVTRTEFEASLGEVREQLGEDDYRREEQAGSKMSLREAIAEA